jgi:thiamine-phosphate pyrophosphorylase
VGLDYVRFATGRAARPVFVTGGASPATVAGIVGAGARRVVAVRWLTEAADPEAAARVLRRTLDAAIAEAEAGEPADPSPG